MVYDFKRIEKEAKEIWKKINLLKKLQKKNFKGKNYFLLDGPPYANFVPHVGHIRNTVYKDLNIRLAFSNGYNVFFQPGFDTHGLPVENMVERKLQLGSKKDIEKMGIKKFVTECKKHAAENKDLWLTVYGLLGSWYTAKEPYMTYDNSYLLSAWWSFKEMWKKNLVYEGRKPVFWCPRCETALAGYEVSDSYVVLSDPAIYVKFKVKGKDEYLFVFTTTPYTLISNVAIAVHPDEKYVKVETGNGVLIIAKERLELLTELELAYKIISEFKGKELDGLEYYPILGVPQQEEISKDAGSHKVYMSIPILKERVASKVAAKKTVGESGDIYEDFVTVKEGTGLVHAAPGHGKTDNEVGRHYGLLEVSPVDDEGKFTELAGKYSGLFVKDADRLIIEDLEKNNRLIHSTKIEHKYPVCWRCKTPLLFRMSKQWFFRVTEIRNKMLAANEKVKWYPGYAKERFRDWISNAEDWNFSRQRYWGIPIPVWKCGCGKIEVIGGLDELKKKSVNKIKDGFDLHASSEVRLKCVCGNEMERISDIFDVWFDSGIAPWASLGYPYENKKVFEEIFPVSRINESQDQIRGWFYSLMFCSISIFGKEPYKEVSMPGWVLDDKGNKMSKSLGNMVYADEVLKKFGADAVRFYYLWDVAPYETQKFNLKTIEKEVWRFFNTLWNMHIYLISKADSVKERRIKNVEDRWLLSRFNSLIKNVNQGLDNFEYLNVARDIEDFVLNTLSRDYVKLVRARVDEQDLDAIYSIFVSYIGVLKLLAVIAPHITEVIYQELKRKFKLDVKSICLYSWPELDDKLIDKELEKKFELVSKITQEGLASRDKIGYGVRWPLPKLTVQIEDIKKLKDVEWVIKKQINVRELIVKKGDFHVVLDSKITKELECEGYLREVIRRIQDLRKKKGLKVKDRVFLDINSDFDLSSFKNEIRSKVGAKKVTFNEKKYGILSIEKIKGRSFEIGFQKV